MKVSKGKFQKIRRRQKLLAFLRMVRFPNLIIIGITQLMVGVYLIDQKWWIDNSLIFQFGILIIATASSAAGGYIINDYYDVKIDVLNKPKRVVVGQYITRRKSIIIHFALAGFSILISLLTNFKIVMVVAFCSGWLWLYSNRLKRLPFIGNFSVAGLTTISIYLPSLLLYPPKKELFLFCTFAFWVSLIREIVKDLEDVKGDSRHGCQTLPIILGARKTKKIIYIISSLFFCNMLYATTLLSSSWNLFSIVIGGILVYLLLKLNRTDTVHGYSVLSRWLKWVMVLGIISIGFI